jgi:hypothetical protein
MVQVYENQLPSQVEGAETKGKKGRQIEPGLQIVWFTEDFHTEESFGKGQDGWSQHLKEEEGAYTILDKCSPWPAWIYLVFLKKY